MDLSISHGQAQRLLKQRNMLAITATGLFALSIVLTLTAAHRDREVVLQPVLAKPLTLSSNHVDKDYLELVTRDAALLTLNRSPSNLQYWMDSILAITDPRTHGRMKAELMKIFKEMVSDWTNDGFDPFAAPRETGVPWGTKNGDNDDAVSRERVTVRLRYETLCDSSLALILLISLLTVEWVGRRVIRLL